ncbi:MAG TPA: histidinol phosphate phosphatase domain-containing protein [Candidatus Omnitrophota bacterium]|nr:histidinol phosphate phosphatase domain-containing protein [Candidatus Omnitrophota bacterium]
MIDLHTHSFLSDGVLIPSELARRADAAGYKAIAITDHADHSNIESILYGITRAAKVLTKYWGIVVIPGVELTHIPIETFCQLSKDARKMGARIVVAHGESPVEPVLPGTNRAAILAGVDILAHPGYITEEDAALAAEKGVYLEITARRGHDLGNKHVFEAARKTGAKMVLNTDSHMPEDLLSEEKINKIIGALTSSCEIKAEILKNSEDIVARLKR